MANFTGKSSCQAPHCERPHHKQYLKAIFSFSTETRRHSIFSQRKADRAGLALVKIERRTCKSPAFDFTLTLMYTCTRAVHMHASLRVRTHTHIHTNSSFLFSPSFPFPLYLLSPQFSHLLIQFSQINSTCINFNMSSHTTVTLWVLFSALSLPVALNVTSHVV